MSKHDPMRVMQQVEIEQRARARVAALRDAKPAETKTAPPAETKTAAPPDADTPTEPTP